MKILNRRAKFNYQLLDRYEAGIVLTGAETKAVKAGRININQAHAKLVNSEVFLINANITVPQKDYQPTRSRKLLLHRHEITSITSKLKAKRLVLIPTKIYTKGRLIKLEIALAKFRRKVQKRELLKKRDLDRELQRNL
jgi:SsrA-binding protein